MNGEGRMTEGAPEPYEPIDCSLHDRLEALATVGRNCRVVYLDDAGRVRELEGRIVDVFTRSSAEFLEFESGQVIRLDRIESVDGIDFRAG